MLVSHSMAHLTRILFSREIVIFVCLGCLRVDFTEAEGAVAFIKDTADLGIGKVSRHKRASGTLIPIPAEEREAGVLRHNEYRAKQQASNMEYMTWNSELARMAEEYIQKCVFEHSDMRNIDNEYNFTYKRVGENLHYNTKELSLSKAVDAWYIEINYYTYESNTCAAGEVCGHYTQVVWAKSEMVGCAKVLCPLLEVPAKQKTVKNAVYTGCNYGGPQMKVDLQKVGYLALSGGLNRQTAQHSLHTMHSDCAYARSRGHMRLSMKMYQEDPDDLKKHANNPSEINNSHDPAFDVGNYGNLKPFLLGDPCSECDPKSYPADHGCKMGLCYKGTNDNGGTGTDSGGTGSNTGGTGGSGDGNLADEGTNDNGGTGTDSGGTGSNTGGTGGSGDGNQAGCLRTFHYHIVFPVLALYITYYQ